MRPAYIFVYLIHVRHLNTSASHPSNVLSRIVSWMDFYHAHLDAVAGSHMTTLRFTPNLARLVDAPSAELEGGTVREVLEFYFQTHPRVRGYMLDDQGALRKHVAVFVNKELIRDRATQSDPVGAHDTIFVAQALSGG